MSPASSLGPNYKPEFHTPIIGRAPLVAVPETFYNATYPGTPIQTTPAAHNALTIRISNPAHGGLFAMCSGLLFFAPHDHPDVASVLSRYPGLPALSPGAGLLTLQVWVDDVNTLKKVLPPRVPPMLEVLYLNVDPSGVRTALTPVVQNPEINSDDWLRSLWPEPASIPDRKLLEDNYLDLILSGLAPTLVRGATPIGNAISDSAAPVSAGVSFTLFFIDRGGNGTSPIPHLLGLPSYDSVQWTGHPLLKALTGVPLPVNFYLQFEVWNEDTGARKFEPLAGVDIDLVSARGRIATQKTDPGGRVTFAIPNLRAVAGDMSKVFWIAHTKRIEIGGQVLPDEWSTDGWMAKDGKTPASYANFTGSQLGDASAPLVICVGLDFHFKIEYLDLSMSLPSWAVAPKGIPVGIHVTSTWGVTTFPSVIRTLTTDQNGEVHGVIFDVSPRKNIYLHVDFELEDFSIDLPKVAVNVLRWNTIEMDDDSIPYPNNVLTSLGTQSKPTSVRCKSKNRNLALYVLKITVEWSTFLFHLTGGLWRGFQELNILLFVSPTIAGQKLRSFSWPAGTVNIESANYWERDTLVHELSHQIMWVKSTFTDTGIATRFLTGNYHHSHYPSFKTDPLTALLEGWAAFVEAIFVPPAGGAWQLTKVTDPNGNPVNKWNDQIINPNLGESVEGAFANGLLAIFWKHVAKGFTAQNQILESLNGDITKKNSWIKTNGPNMQPAFIRLFFDPLSELKTKVFVHTRDMLDGMRLHNATIWHELLAELQALNMYIEQPTIKTVSPARGPLAGGTHVEVTGENFSSTTSVTVDGIAATMLTIAASSLLSFHTPQGSQVGSVALSITTVAGTATSIYAYT